MSRKPPILPRPVPQETAPPSRIPYSQIGILGFCCLWFLMGLQSLVGFSEENGGVLFLIGLLLTLAGLPFLLYGIWRGLRKVPPAKYRWLTLTNALLFLGGIGLTMIPMLIPAIHAGKLAAERAEVERQAATTIHVVSADGLYRISVPGTWESNPDLSSAGEAVWGDLQADRWLSLHSIAKQDLVDASLETSLKSTLDAVASIGTELEVLGSRTGQLGGHSAMDLTISAQVENVRITYWLTAIETPEHIVDLRFWTRRSRFDDSLTTFERIADSLEVVPNDSAP